MNSVTPVEATGRSVAVRARMRARARHVALDAWWAQRALRRVNDSALRRPRVHFPYLHAVPGSEEETFRRFLEALAVHHTFVSYSEGVRRVLQGPIDKPYIALSFDDGFKSNFRISRVLDEYGISGCFFVPPGFIGTETVREARRFFGFSEGVDEPAMSWADLEDMRSRGHEIANHTMNHRVMSWISHDEMLSEIGQGAEELRARLGESRHFAWPRGRFWHFTPEARDAVFGTGHLSCASAERGAHAAVQGKDHRTLCIRRDHEMTSWPMRHQMFFVARGSERSSAAANEWPTVWPTGPR